MYFSDIFRPMKWHIIACIIAFYALPMLTFVVPQEGLLTVMLISEEVNTTVVLITSIVLTIKEGFKWYYPFVVMFLYAPACFLYYGESMLANIVVYLLLSYTAQIIGFIVRKIIERNR